MELWQQAHQDLVFADVLLLSFSLPQAAENLLLCWSEMMNQTLTPQAWMFSDVLMLPLVMKYQRANQMDDLIGMFLVTGPEMADAFLCWSEMMNQTLTPQAWMFSDVLMLPLAMKYQRANLMIGMFLVTGHVTAEDSLLYWSEMK